MQNFDGLGLKSFLLVLFSAVAEGVKKILSVVADSA
jgi:hypothetical protein